MTVVNNVAVTSIVLTESSITLSLEKQESRNLFAKVIPANASNPNVIWSSSNEKVAFVSASGNVIARGAGTAVITCTSAENAAVKARCTVTVTPPVAAQHIELNKSKATLNLASYEVCALSGKVHPENADSKELFWESENLSIAVVTATGLVVPLSEGKVNITCSLESNPAVKASCEITVVHRVEMSNILFFDREVKLDWSFDETHYLQHIILPSNATEKQLVWTSSNPAVASVAEGVITPVSVGNAIISCHAAADESISAACNVMVYSSRKPEEVSITGAVVSKLDIGESLLLGHVFAPVKSHEEITWTSSARNVASVDDNGLVTAISEGSVFITVSTANGKKDTVALTVIDPEKPTGIILDCGSTLLIGDGEEIQLNAELKPDTAIAELAWSSSNTKYATVDDDGLVTGIRKGTAIITATATDKKGTQVSAEVEVSVKYAPTRITLNTEVAEMTLADEPLQLDASLNSAGASMLSWESSNESVAEVDENGVVTPVALGTAEITCSTFNGKTAKCTVSVSSEPTMILVPEIEINMYYRQSLNLNAELADDEGNPCFGTISYESSHPDNVSVDAKGNVTVKKKSLGTAEITLISDNGLEEIITINVCSAPASVTLEETETKLEKGDEYQIEPIIGDDEAATFSYSTSNKRVATVDKNGVVTAVGKGTAKITVRTQNKKSVALQLTVTDPYTPEKVVLDESGTIELAVGEELPLYAEIFPDTAESELSWTSSRISVASVDEDGAVTAVKKGTATITVKTANGKKDTVKIKVV